MEEDDGGKMKAFETEMLGGGGGGEGEAEEGAGGDGFFPTRDDEELRDMAGKKADLQLGLDVHGMATLKEKIVILNPVVDFGVFRTLDDPVVVKVTVC